MSLPSSSHKHFASARKRFLREALSRFYEEHFPRHLGPFLRERFAAELLAFFEAQLLPITHLRPGQCLWNAVAIETRPDSPKLRCVPVILTLVQEEDVIRLAAGTPLSALRAEIVARLLQEAYAQGGLLSMRDLSLLVWTHDNQLSTYRQAFEERTGHLLPHPGSLQDMGTCISHKTSIVSKVVGEHQDPRKVAATTRHSQHAVDRYLKDFHRVRACYQQRPDPDFICQVTGMSKRLVTQYLDLIRQFETPDTTPLTGDPA